MKIIDSLSEKVSHLFFLVSKPFALLAYRCRKFQYKNKYAPIRWYTNARLIADDLYLINDEDGKNAINKDFVNTLVSGRAKSQHQVNKYSAVSIGIILFLLMGVFEIELPIKIFGITLKATSGVNEFLLFALSFVTVLTISPLLNSIVLGSAIKGTIDVLYRDSVKPFYHQSEFPDEVPLLHKPYYRPSLHWTVGVFWANNLKIVFLLAYIIGLIALLFSTRWWIYSYIYLNPMTCDPTLPPIFGRVRPTKETDNEAFTF